VKHNQVEEVSAPVG